MNDPDILKACIAGCESIERLTDTEYTVVTTAAIGPVKAKFRGKLLLADLPAQFLFALLRRPGRRSGFRQGLGQRCRSPTEGTGTRLSYAVKARWAASWRRSARA